MPTKTMSISLGAGGVTVQGVISRTAEGQIGQEVSLPAAEVGTLSTRTSDTAGTLTLADDHEITDADVIDIFWTDANGVTQCAYGATVGTVAGTSVPFTGASGTALPTATTAITADVLTEIDVDFDGDDVQLIALMSTRKGHFDFQDSGDASLEQDKLAASEPWSWAYGMGLANPLTGNPVDKLFVSNGDSDNAATVKLAVLYDSVA